MPDKVITSLCYVDSKNDKTTRLCRIADYENGRFHPYTYDPNQDFFGEDRDLLIGQNYDVLAEEGEIAVFNWYSYLGGENQWRTNVKRNNDVSWCEVFPKYQYDSPYKVVEYLRKDGITVAPNYNVKHDLIIVTVMDSTGSNAVYLHKEDVKLINGKLAVADNVVKLSIGTIDVTRDSESCQCRYLKNEQRYMRGPDGFKEKKTQSVKNPVEIIQNIVQGNAGYFDTDVMTRREKQLLRSVISRITEPTIVDMVCDRTGCTVNEAREYIDQYVETAKLKLDRQTTVSIIEKLIENDVDAVKEMKKAIGEEWLSENKSLVEDKKKEIEHYTEALRTAEEAAKKETERVKQVVLQEEGKRERLLKDNKELTESVEKFKKLKDDLEQEIQDRLSKAKENLAGSMLDHALLMPATQVQQPVVTEGTAPKAFTITFHGEETEKAKVYDCHDTAQTDWERICGDEEMSVGWALIALAAFACNRPVLVAGEGAEMIADMLAVSVCGHIPLKLHIRNEADLETLAAEVDAHDHEIICVINGLESGYTVSRELMEHFQNSRFIFTVRHCESLAMEPESLFYTFFPVLTEYFYNGRQIQDLPTLDCREELMQLQNSDYEKKAFREAKKIVGRWFKDVYFPPLFKTSCARLMASMIMLSEIVDISDTMLHTAEMELVLTPWLKCLRKTDLLQKILEEDNAIDEYKKKDLLSYIGTDGM